MTPQERATAQAVCDAATAPPWEWVDIHDPLQLEGPTRSVVNVTAADGYCLCSDIDEPDAAFIAQSRTLLPQALDEIRRLREALVFYAQPGQYEILAGAIARAALAGEEGEG